MIGTFYRAANPESPSFVEPGDRIKPGQTVCIIEAMKLFNEIEAEISGTIVEILVDNATPVEFDQPLFLVDPS
jgi:acetyl-CoA carboxylase biotin carboxyl carrier protein